MTLPLRLLLLFAVAAVAAIVLWPNSAPLPFQPGKPYTGPGFEVVADTPCPISSGWIALAPENASSTAAGTAATPTYRIACVQPVYLANGDVLAIPVAAQWLGTAYIGSNSYDVYNYYLIPAPLNVSFVVYGGQGYLVSKQYFAPFNYTLYIVEPVAAVPMVAGWRYIGDINVYYYGAADIYHLYLADASWKIYKAIYVNATIAADPAMYYFLPRK
jgi:hypothetical protein